MKKLLLIVLISGTTIIAAAQNAFLTKPLSGQLVKQIEAQTAGGNIWVESVADAEARIEVFVRESGGNKSREEIQQKLEEFYDLKIVVQDNKLTAIAKSKKQNMSWRNSLSISFKIFTNKNVSTHLVTSGGDIDIKALAGDQQFTTSGGSLTIDNVKGKLKGLTSGGNIRVSNAGDDIDLATSGGNVEASNCSGNILLSTSGGDVTLANLTGTIDATTSGGHVKANDITGDLTASTSGGNITLLGLSGDLSAGTSGGNIKIVMKAPGKFIKLKNSGGNITLELPAGKGYDFDLSANKIKTDNLTNFSGKIEDDEMKGSINGGGTLVTAKGGDGKIIVVFR
jgi:DUF4097 and DUF4098 domain-containing protein YvlB